MDLEQFKNFTPQQNMSMDEYGELNDIEKVVNSVEKFLVETKDQIPLLDELPMEKQDLKYN